MTSKDKFDDLQGKLSKIYFDSDEIFPFNWVLYTNSNVSTMSPCEDEMAQMGRYLDFWNRSAEMKHRKMKFKITVDVEIE